jgi:hypothetical protein
VGAVWYGLACIVVSLSQGFLEASEIRFFFFSLEGVWWLSCHGVRIYIGFASHEVCMV